MSCYIYNLKLCGDAPFEVRDPGCLGMTCFSPASYTQGRTKDRPAQITQVCTGRHMSGKCVSWGTFSHELERDRIGVGWQVQKQLTEATNG